MNVDLMELADCGSPERLIASILKANPSLEIPVPIEKLAQAVGISEIERVAADGFEGTLATNAEKSTGIIAVNERSSHQRQRFTIAHEIGHFLIPTHTGDSRCASADLSRFGMDDPAVKREAEANRFAAGILMPAPYFRRDVGKIGDPDLSVLVRLAELYETSLEATVNRFVDFTSFCCAVIFSRNGHIRYPRPTDSFPWMGLNSGAPLPENSLSAKDQTSTRETPSDWKELPSEVWLSSDLRGKRLPPVLEQTMRLNDGYRVTLLQIEANEDDEDEDDEDLEESWDIRFRR